MNPENGGYFTGYTLLKTSLLTVAFSAMNVYDPSQKILFFKAPTFPVIVAKTEVAVKQPVEKKKKKTIYLTFDDGPNAGTKKVMDILKAEDVPATLFLIGEHVYGSRMQKDIFDSLQVSKNIELANHSYSHACNNNFTYFYNNADTVLKDFERCADSLKFNNRIVRTPGRNIWRTENISSTDIKKSTAAADSLQTKKFIAVGWDVEWHFTSSQNLVQSDTLMEAQIVNAFSRNNTKAKNALVLLAHDRTFLSPGDSGSLHNLIRKLKSSGLYDFETLSKYPF